MASGAVPAMYGNNTAAGSGSEDQDGGLDVWGFIKRRKSFVIVLGIVGTVCGYMLFQRQVPNYRSSALVQVIHKSADTKLDGMLSERDLMDAAFVITSPSIVQPAVQKHGLAELSMMRGNSSEDVVNIVSGMLKIKTGATNTNVVEIAVEGSRAEEIPQIANAVAAEYVNKQMENYQDARGELERLLTRAKDELHGELKQKETEYNEFRERSGLMSDGKNPHRERQQAVLAQVSLLSLRETALKAELTTLEEALRTNGAQGAILILIGKTIENTSSGPVVDPFADRALSSKKAMMDALLPLLVEQAELEETLGKDHPKVDSIKRRIKFAQEHAEKIARMTPEELKAQESKADPRQEYIANYLQSLRQELASIKKERTELDVQAADAERLARALGKDENEDRTRTSEINRLEKMFDDVSSQMRETNVNANMGGVKAQVLTPARHGVLVFPKLSQFLGLGAFLGAFSGIALGYLVEMADRSFRKPEDIIREFGVPIIGHVPFMTEQRLKSGSESHPMDKTAVSVHLPRSRPAEAYRAVRTAICFSAFGGSHRVISVTSPAAGDGKSTLALNLSLSMAQSGKRTVLVESDFRRPKVHKLTGVENKVGLVDVLRGDAELVDAIVATSVPDFFVLPCGTRPRDPAELLARPQYEQLLQVLREQFEYVIIDTPPVLAVTDPCGVAARVDGVLICMRLSRHTRDLGRRTVEQLRDVGATIAGIVINGVEERDAYGYGNYRYSDYRYYYKNYNYKYGGYSSKDGNEYYADDTSGEISLLASEKKTKS